MNLSHCSTGTDIAGIFDRDDATKIALGACILIVAVAFGAVPMWLVTTQIEEVKESTGRRMHRTAHILVRYGNSFSAGVFLAMGITHLLPEANASFVLWLGPHSVAVYHPAELFVVIGYALILALQRVVFRTPTCPHAMSSASAVDHGHGGHSHAHEQDVLMEDRHTTYGTPSHFPTSRTLRAACNSGKHCDSACDRPCGVPSPNAVMITSPVVSANASSGPSSERESVNSQHLLLDRTERIATADPAEWTLVLALSVHAVLEGIALGLQCGTRNIVLLGSGICAHKWAESFTLSNTLAHEAMGRSGLQDTSLRRAWRILFLFACATPLGTFAGLVLHSRIPPTSAGIVKALSAGTFMYIGASEVVVEEFVQGRQYWGKWFCFLSGVAVMYGISVFFHLLR